MNKDIKDNIEKLFIQNRGYARTGELIKKGIHSSYIYELESEGIITKVKRGLFKLTEYSFEEENELVEVSKIIPNGVVCLLSALSFYEFTTYNPWEYYVAVFRKSRTPVISEYPPIKILYFSEKQYSIGLTTIEIAGNEVKIYDREKTICDCVRYRNKIGMDIFKEALKEYLKYKEKDLSKLMKYAENLGVKKVLKDYLEVLI